MHPNQLYVRWTQLGGQTSLWIIGIFVAAVLVKFAWYVVHQPPRVVGIEIAALLLLLALAVFPPCWVLIRNARRRYRARGLLSYKLTGLAYTLLVVGILYGVVFPLCLLIELLRVDLNVDLSLTSWLWLTLGYLLKVGLALLLARAGWQLLRHEPASHDPKSEPAA